ncbi:hypothetical protein O181_032798 [Austropuccinia psidii MF-1]|uniref:Uncharacterized protein n=1 Tax=Austropuccinia psidii MF-1 TaxID=1389203 RepID=A0A9Q3D072_9BASI|nr:hypothetical protein [Austropuccinia psidii MF-1]
MVSVTDRSFASDLTPVSPTDSGTHLVYLAQYCNCAGRRFLSFSHLAFAILTQLYQLLDSDLELDDIAKRSTVGAVACWPQGWPQPGCHDAPPGAIAQPRRHPYLRPTNPSPASDSIMSKRKLCNTTSRAKLFVQLTLLSLPSKPVFFKMQIASLVFLVASVVNFGSAAVSRGVQTFNRTNPINVWTINEFTSDDSQVSFSVTLGGALDQNSTCGPSSLMNEWVQCTGSLSTNFSYNPQNQELSLSSNVTQNAIDGTLYSLLKGCGPVDATQKSFQVPALSLEDFADDSASSPQPPPEPPLF